jgi:LmbE family N-acetylglucosaminyl deacetylase
MVVHAHPDDEVFSTGGILAKYAAAGDRVVVVYATNGEEGEMHDPARDPADTMTRLGEIRQQEAREACALLGVTDIVFLGYHDSGMRDSDANKNPAAFMNVPLDQAAGRLMDIMRETQPQVVVTYDEEGGYGHPDHVMTNRMTVAAFERAQGEPWAPQKLYYPAGSREAFRRYAEDLKRLGLKIPWLDGDFDFDGYGKPEADITTKIDIRPWAPLKKAALAIHRTQIPSDFFYLSIPDDSFRDVVGTEFFMRVAPPGDEREDDLFTGIRDRAEAA